MAVLGVSWNFPPLPALNCDLLLGVDRNGPRKRDKDEVRESLFNCVDLEQRIRPDYPLRVIRAIVDAASPPSPG